MKTVQPKQTTPRRFSSATVVLAAMLASGILASCTKGVEQSTTDSSLIALSAAMGTIDGELDEQDSAQTKAPAVGTDLLTLYFAHADEASAGTYGDYAATALSATRAAGPDAQPLTFGTPQKYLVNGRKTKFTGWYPGGATAKGDASGNGYYDGTARTVSWTIDGQQDVMTAPLQQGSSANAMLVLTFNHRLTQLRFHPYTETQEIVDEWGKITNIEVLDQQNTVIYSLTDDASGTVSFSGAATNIFSAGIAYGGAALSLSTTANKVTDAKQMGNPVMIVPQSSSSYTLKLRITTKNRKKTVTLTQALTAGTPYRLYMKFDADVLIETAVAQWDNVATSDMLGLPRVLMYYGDAAHNGGITTDLQGSTTSSYNGFTIGNNGTVYDSAEAAYANEKPYYRLEVARESEPNTSWENAYNSCKSKTTDGGGWRLPRLSELWLMWLNKSSLNATPWFTPLSPYSTWSGSESYSGTTWDINFTKGHINSATKSNAFFFRCVREI